MIKNNSERPVDALAEKKITHSLTDNFKSRDASASNKQCNGGHQEEIIDQVTDGDDGDDDDDDDDEHLKEE